MRADRGLAMNRELLACLACLLWVVAPYPVAAEPPSPATFSIVAADPEAHEVGVAVASRFFAVGTVVPHGTADVGAVATQAYANTAYGPRGLDLLARGLEPEEVLEVLLRQDPQRAQRQVGVVSADGKSATYTGPGCNSWAGGRHGPGYAVQGNILTGEEVVAGMEQAFLNSAGQPLARRLYAALVAGDTAGGDSRGKQSAALIVKRAGAGYGGFTDQAIDLRVDDHAEPIKELGRLLEIALVNDLWNRGWNAFMEKRYPEALHWQEETAKAAVGATVYPEVLYDLAVIRLANDDREGALSALANAVAANPQLKAQAMVDSDLDRIRSELQKLPSFD
jgi:uncharacterized Ntn-hydrolase superfamily protein